MPIFSLFALIYKPFEAARAAAVVLSKRKCLTAKYSKQGPQRTRRSAGLWKSWSRRRLERNEVDPLFPIPNSRDSSFAARYGFIRAERRPGVDAQRKMHSGDESGGLQRYIDDGVSGYWIDDLATDLPRLIRLLEVDPARATGRRLGRLLSPLRSPRVSVRSCCPRPLAHGAGIRARAALARRRLRALGPPGRRESRDARCALPLRRRGRRPARARVRPPGGPADRSIMRGFSPADR